MKLQCTQEAIADNGSKVMEFTFGATYDAYQDDEGTYIIHDDNNKAEEFWNPFFMFKQLK